MSKEDNIKEKFKIALVSTAKAISDDYDPQDDKKKPKKIDFFELDNLDKKEDFIKYRAEADSNALRKKFSNEEIFKSNCPKNPSCKSLYDLSEKIRCELLGSKILKGVKNNFRENYLNKLYLKRKDQLDKKDDVNVSEAFELYLLKNFFNIKFNKLNEKILEFWEGDFEKSFKKHLDFLNNNLEYQNEYNKKFSEILQDMDIFEDSKDTTENENDQSSDGNEDDNFNNKDDDESNNKDQQQMDEDQKAFDSDYDFSEHKIDEQISDTDSEKQSSETVVQKFNLDTLDKDYKIFTKEYDEISKAENLENIEEINKLRKNLDQQLISFQDLITKLANKLQRQLLASQKRSWEFDKCFSRCEY